jgi:dTDP-4-amino-4,6-dideoxygalactose transaminase
MAVKFVDLQAQNAEIRERVEREFDAIHLRTAYVGGAQVDDFEAEFASFLGARKVVGVSSGTDALRLAMLALGIGPGDEVITVPMTFIATIEAILQTGARPVFVDVDRDSCNMSPQALSRYLEGGNFATPKGPRAILPVHLYGLPAPMAELGKIAERFGLKVIEDACQAHGARIRMGEQWRRAGTVSDAGCFSFYPGKNLGAWGEAGAVATDDETIAECVANLRDHGRTTHYTHGAIGYNARLDALQAAVLRAKLERLSAWNARRVRIAAMYREMLSGCDLIMPAEPESAESCYHLFVVRSLRREAIREHLVAAQIGCGIHYPVPLHLQPACRFLGYRRGDFPVSEEIGDTVVSLPMHPHLTDAEVMQVADVVRSALTRH